MTRRKIAISLWVFLWQVDFHMHHWYQNCSLSFPQGEWYFQRALTNNIEFITPRSITILIRWYSLIQYAESITYILLLLILKDNVRYILCVVKIITKYNHAFYDSFLLYLIYHPFLAGCWWDRLRGFGSGPVVRPFPWESIFSIGLAQGPWEFQRAQKWWWQIVQSTIQTGLQLKKQDPLSWK